MARTDQSKEPQKQRPGFAAGSEGWDGTEDPTRPVASSDEAMAASTEPTEPGERDKPTQSDYSLSQASDSESEDGRFSVAEEVNLDEQTNEARRVGLPPKQAGTKDVSEAIGESLQRDEQSDEGEDKAKLERAVGRSVPPSA